MRRDVDMAASAAVGSQHTLKIIHYHPDPFRVDGKPERESKASRIKRLLQVLSEEPVGFERIFICYDGTSDSHLPQVACSWPEAVREVSRVV